MRYKLILHALAKKDTKIKRLLDIGSGQGDFLSTATQANIAEAYTGFELSASGVQISRHKLPHAQFLQVDIFNPPPAAAAFENWATAITCSEVIEHVDDPVAFMRQVSKYLKPEGTIIVTVPSGPMSTFDNYIGHRQHFTEQTIRHTLNSAGYTVDTVWRAGFPFFNLYRLLIILRGQRLIEDAKPQPDGTAASGLARVAMAIFWFLFKFNLRNTPFV